MTAKSKGTSFYFFDFDDNIMFLPTKIIVRDPTKKEGEQEKELSTGEFANVHPHLGKAGEWESYTLFDGSFRNFRDRPDLKSGQKQTFVKDVERAVKSDPAVWQGPAWKVFVYACAKQRPVSIITARGHSVETLQAGVKVLVEKGLIAKEPKYRAVYPVGNDDVRKNQLDDPKLEIPTPVLKKRAILKTVEKAVEQYGVDAELRFGMSDDDPANVNLIIQAMAEAKKKYVDKRFFVVNTHKGEKVKLEVFPVDFPVTGQPKRVLSDS